MQMSLEICLQQAEVLFRAKLVDRRGDHGMDVLQVLHSARQRRAVMHPVEEPYPALEIRRVVSHPRLQVGTTRRSSITSRTR